jgi:NDP-sugar pyrophosphorylase family protein
MLSGFPVSIGAASFITKKRIIMTDYYTHPNGGGKIAITANVSEYAYVGPEVQVLDNAYIDDTCSLYDRVIVKGNVILTNRVIARDNVIISGKAVLSNVALHSDINISETPIIIHGFENEILITSSHVMIGCMVKTHQEWQDRGVAFFRANGFPKISAERIHSMINVVIEAHKSLYHPDDIAQQFRLASQ